MKIRKLTATFGKLKNQTLEPGEGLTVISAPNESGKTTWCAFLNAMLYGVDTSERDKAGILSVKTRYRPWDGGGMVGTMELEKDGREITVQRTSKGASPMKNFIAVYTGTADFIEEMNGENAGETLTGVSRQVFERTAFVRRPDIRVTQTSELERKIHSIVSSGDEDTSFTDSDAALRRWQRKLRYNKSGSIPQLEQELRDARHALELIESSNEEIANLRSGMERQEKQIQLMERDLEIHDQLDRRAASRRLREAEKNAAETARRVEELKAAITKNGHEMTREDINEIRETAAAVMPLKKVAQDAERALWRAEKELVDANTRRTASPLYGTEEKTVAEDIARGRELESRAGDVKEPRIPRIIPILLWVLAVAGLVLTTGLLTPLFRETVPDILRFNLPGVAASLAVGAVGLVLFFLKPPRKRGAGEELAELLAKYGVQSVEKLESLREGYAMTTREEEQRRAARDAARAAYESAGAAAQEAGERAVEKLSAFMPGVNSGEEIMDALNETERLIDSLTKAEFDAVSARNVYETLSAGYDGEEQEEDTYLPVPIRNREDTVAALDRSRAQLAEATRAYDLAVGAQRTLGDPAVIEGRIQRLTELLAQENTRYAALTLAVETLSQANADLQARFSPEVSRLAGEYMAELTGGRYEKLYFDKGFDAGAKEAASPEMRRVIALSDGTGDEIYLSLRLALCQLILGGDDPCPIVLDDALANFDDDRCRKALELLRRLAEKRQIILFTCHSREADMLEGKRDVKIIRGAL